jgi:soluble lytic murein transglycosylase
MRLADGHIGRRDSARAEPYLLEEIAAGGSEAERARYLVARVRLGRRDVQGAAEQFRLLATADSTGYYGLLARQAADLPEPVFDPTPPRAIDSTAADLLAQLSLLDDAGLTREADVLVADIVSRTWPDADAALDAAEGLVRLGRANQAIRLGYTASRSLGPHHPRVLRAVFPWPDRGLISAEAEAFGLDPYLVAGLIRQESWFLPTARSRAGAVGYMQLMPATAREVARRLGVVWSDGLLTVGDANVHVGSAHLAALLRTYQGDTVRALAAYNAGGRPVARWSRLPGSVDPASFVEQISYPETRGYVRSVVRNRALYRALYPTPAVP